MIKRRDLFIEKTGKKIIIERKELIQKINFKD